MADVTCTEEGCEVTKLKARGLCMKHYKPAKRYPPQSLKPAEFARLVAAADGPAWNNKRDVALMMLLAHSGVRIAEALALKRDDIDWDEAPKVKLFIAHGKGDKSRTVMLGVQGQETVREYLEVPKAFNVPCPWVFPSGSGAPLDHSQVRRLFRRLGKKAGITKRVHPHGLRHTYAVEVAKMKKRPEMLQRQLGHTNLGTTTRYLSTIAPEELADELWDM